MRGDGALVLFSGGQDSTTCLAWALDGYDRVETVGFAYGQRHAVELACRGPVREALAARPAWGARLGPDHVLDISAGLLGLGETAMTAEVAIETTASGLPNTFVPGRNLLFLTYAAALARRRGLRRVVGGMCETDFSGYPDCRDDTIKAMQLALNLGMDGRFVLETPLMWLDKAQTWALSDRLGVLDVVVERSHTCYLGDRTRRHEWGWGCGTCPACALRARGWERFKRGGAGAAGCPGARRTPRADPASRARAGRGHPPRPRPGTDTAGAPAARAISRARRRVRAFGPWHGPAPPEAPLMRPADREAPWRDAGAGGFGADRGGRLRDPRPPIGRTPAGTRVPAPRHGIGPMGHECARCTPRGSRGRLTPARARFASPRRRARA